MPKEGGRQVGVATPEAGGGGQNAQSQAGLRGRPRAEASVVDRTVVFSAGQWGAVENSNHRRAAGTKST